MKTIILLILSFFVINTALAQTTDKNKTEQKQKITLEKKQNIKKADKTEKKQVIEKALLKAKSEGKKSIKLK